MLLVTYIVSNCSLVCESFSRKDVLLVSKTWNELCILKAFKHSDSKCSDSNPGWNDVSRSEKRSFWLVRYRNVASPVIPFCVQAGYIMLYKVFSRTLRYIYWEWAQSPIINPRSVLVVGLCHTEVWAITMIQKTWKEGKKVDVITRNHITFVYRMHLIVIWCAL